MKSNDISKPIIKKKAARAYYLRIAAEWQTGKKRVPSRVLEQAEIAACLMLARHACQPKAHIKLPRPGHGDKPSANP